MKSILLLFHLLLAGFLSVAQVSADFEKKFNQARAYMEDFQFEKASPILENLVEGDPTNANLQYLLGVCYTMGPVVDNRAIGLLENSKVEMSQDYNAASASERKVSQNVYFYLAVAYAQSFNFEEANRANDYFHELTGTINGRYMRDASLWINKMQELKGLLATEPVDAYDNTYGWEDEEAATQGFYKEEDEGDFGLSEKFYGVQIGAFAQSIPSFIFSGTENVKAYRGQEGLVRFVVGNLKTREEAVALRDKMRRSGYTDAFIVHLDRKDFVQEVK